MMKSWREARNDRILKYVLEKGVSFGESVLLRPREMVCSAGNQCEMTCLCVLACGDVTIVRVILALQLGQVNEYTTLEQRSEWYLRG